MGQGPILRKPPSQGPVMSPEGDPTWLDQILHKVGVAAGVSDQAPGDFGDAAAAGFGAMAPMLPIGKLLKMLRLGQIASEVDEVPKAVNMGDRMLRNHLETELSPKLKTEFNPQLRPDANDFTGLPIEEIRKGESLTSAPKRRKPSEPRPSQEGNSPQTIEAYHGTTKDFPEFSNDAIGSNVDHGAYGAGHYFTGDPGMADTYAMKVTNPNNLGDAIPATGANVRKAALNFQNPFILNADDAASVAQATKLGWKAGLSQDRAAAEKFAETLKSLGHDGVIVTSQYYPKGEYVAFDPSSIKPGWGSPKQRKPNVK